MAPTGTRGVARVRIKTLGTAENLKESREVRALPLPGSTVRGQAKTISELREQAALQRRFGELSPPTTGRGSLIRFGETPPSEGALKKITGSVREFFHKAWLAWVHGSHAAPLLMGLGFLLGAGPPARIREDGLVRNIKFSEGEAPIRFGREDLDSPADQRLPDVLLVKPYVSRNHAELFREGNELFLKDLESKHGTWLWRNRAWQRVNSIRPELLGNGAIFAIGPNPSLQAIANGARRPEDIQAEIYRVGLGEDHNSFWLTTLKPAALRFFLLDLLPVDASPVFAKIGKANLPRQAGKTFHETLRLALSSGLANVEVRTRIIHRLMSLGHYKAAELEMKKAQLDVWEMWNLERYGPNVDTTTLGPISELQHLVGMPLDPSPAELPLIKALVELHFLKAHLLDLSQRPEDGAEPFAAAAVILAPFKSFSRDYKRAAFHAYDRYFRMGEASMDLKNYALAGTRFVQAAQFAEAARAYTEKPYPYPLPKTLSPLELLKLAEDCFIKAGPASNLLKVWVGRELEFIQGKKAGPYR